MATAKIEHLDGGYTVTLRSGDWYAEYERDSFGTATRIIRNHGGALIKRLPVSADIFRDMLVAAQQYEAAETAILLTLKKHSSAGVKGSFK